MRAPLAIISTLLGAVTLACFSERGAGPGTNTAECAVPITVIDSMNVIIAIRDFTFRPDSIRVPPGATVTWINCETPPQEPHTTTSDSSGVWSSPELNTGNRFSHTFPAPGVFPYHCIPHLGIMAGKVVVQ